MDKERMSEYVIHIGEDMKPNIKNYVKIGISILLFLIMDIALSDVPTESSLDKWHIRSIYAKKYKKKQMKGNGDDN